MTRLNALLPLIALTALAACQSRDTILPGVRLDPREIASAEGPAVDGPAGVSSTALNLPAPRSVEWTTRAANPAHLIPHSALAGTGLQPLWSAPIGQPSGRRHRIGADPVVAGGRVFTLDSRAQVAATALNGATAWTRDLTPATERGDSVSGGGIAYEGARVFVTTAYGELVALDTGSGGILWRQRVEAPIGGAPTVQNGVVYVAGRDSTGWAVRAADGRVLWTVSGINAQSGVTGVSAPAVDGDLAVFSFASGQLLAVDTATGVERWSAQVAGTRRGRAIAFIRDLTGDPVIAGDVVLAGSSSGRIAAFDRATGVPLWNEQDGANSPVLVAGGSIFAVNDQAQLVRLDAATGGRIFAVPLPYYTAERVRRQDAIHVHYGPVLAGGRLFVASSDGILRAFDPRSGALVGQAPIPGGAATAPVVSGGTIYVSGRDGRLHAYR
ncbi:PQQ-binding-like beta-propeller repeat protein [Paracoccus sp. (in: a-proteobacteria)]|uniref:outer membrane protein assembly factor BamB family protein n=1 Tax=Paracoccus sp. TaxID=267 RepID=UPI0026DFE0B7|nr:PQQ-binding-like beta-propeller repeat protein [Paracoccus sp. (in: a-proteobacteria)]MDO5370143.1 PQQ-binding-like beta-propeller repeat protein [Paracoccus sp. (in: a-proteobacteria)]